MLIEQRHWGGTCLNTGCIPAKTLLRAAELIKLARIASAYGILFEEPRMDFSRLMKYKEDVEILAATGRKPNTEDLCELGIQMEGQRIAIDE